jgi:hypothetical protein
MEERRKEIFIFFSFNTYVDVPSHTRVSSIGRERPRATLPQENPLIWETPLQHTFIHPFHSFLHLKAWENIQSAAYNLKGLFNFQKC